LTGTLACAYCGLMSDHMTRGSRRRGSRQSVGVRDLKAHAARILRDVRETRRHTWSPIADG
jgi:hypothetical protein